MKFNSKDGPMSALSISIDIDITLLYIDRYRYEIDIKLLVVIRESIAYDHIARL